MADLIAEQARLRPALDRLLRLAAGWADPLAPTEAAAASAPLAAIAGPADGATWSPAPSALQPEPAPQDAGLDAPAVAAASPAAMRSVAVPASGRDPVSNPVGTDPADRVALAPAPVPRFRLAPPPRRPVMPARRGLAGATLGVTGHAAAPRDLPRASAATPASPAAPADERGAAPIWSAPAVSRLTAPSVPEPSAFRGSLAPERPSLPAPRHAAAEAPNGSRVLDATLEADLEERIADILERAALEAGIDLP